MESRYKTMVDAKILLSPEYDFIRTNEFDWDDRV